MKVPYVEDLVNHSSPESCGWYSNVSAEALTGESVGGLLSSEITSVWALEKNWPDNHIEGFLN